jgi:DNA-binding NarL/FixJ family response regulator
MTPAGEQQVRVVVADDHVYYRRGLVQALASLGVDVVAEAAGGAAALREVEATHPHVLLVDLNMPEMSGIATIRRLVSRGDDTRAVALSVTADPDAVIEAFLAGAVGFVFKERPASELVDAVRAAASGQRRVPSAIAIPLLNRLRDRSSETALPSAELDELEAACLRHERR